MFSHDLHEHFEHMIGEGGFHVLQHIYTCEFTQFSVFENAGAGIHVCAHVTSALSGETSKTEPPVPAGLLFYFARRASAPPQLFSTSPRNLRDWELKARWTFFNNEGILCLQYCAWLTHAVWAVLQVNRQTLYSSSAHTRKVVRH